MSKRIFALLLCAVMLIPCLAACAKSEDEEVDPGAYITMYLTDEIYDFDPANAYYNQNAINVVSMMFDTLFKLNENGKVVNSLVKKYSVKEDQRTGEHYMEIKLNETYWSNGTRLQADDVVFAWQRLLRSSNSYPAASLLFDLKNARAAKEGDESIDDVGVEALALDTLKITFEGEIDYDQFLLNLTSVATAPLLQSYVERMNKDNKNDDWAKKPSFMVTSGPYKIGKINYKEILDEDEDPIEAIDDNALDEFGNSKTKRPTGYPIKVINYFYLERNVYYYRDAERDALDKSVKNYRILVDCSKSDEDIIKDYKDGKIFYVGNIPLSQRKEDFVKDNVQTSDALSTFVLYMNQNALIDNDGDEETPGEAIFANADVRKALSLAIDRNAIAEEVVYAEAATGLVCPGVFEGIKKSKTDFRSEGGDLITNKSASIDEAKSLLSSAGIDATKYSFSINVAAYDEENVKIVEMIADSWNQLGFNVTVNQKTTIQNNDVHEDLAGSKGDTPSDICDDLFIESIERKTFEVVAFDYNAFSADAYSMLSSFALSFSGMGLEISQAESGDYVYNMIPHITGYESKEYNDLMEAIYYLPYFATFTDEQLADEKFTFLSIYENHAEYMEAYNTVKAVYDANGITASKKSADWTTQRNTLLHKAEEMLMADMPVIPVVFNQNAILVSDELKNVDATYYIPAYFAKTTLKDYEKYVPALVEFPEVKWSKVED